MCDCCGMFCEEIVWAGHLLVMFTCQRCLLVSGVVNQLPRSKEVAIIPVVVRFRSHMGSVYDPL